jgi:hypothetical protein
MAAVKPAAPALPPAGGPGTSGWSRWRLVGNAGFDPSHPGSVDGTGMNARARQGQLVISPASASRENSGRFFAESCG